MRNKLIFSVKMASLYYSTKRAGNHIQIGRKRKRSFKRFLMTFGIPVRQRHNTKSQMPKYRVSFQEYFPPFSVDFRKGRVPSEAIPTK
jgi:hypothetical protein